jgi:multidrug efflux pump subunit AcrA (membrane-fusion protein)
MTAKVQIARRAGPALPVVPLAALIDADGAQAALYALSPLNTGYTVQRVPIQIAFFAGDRVAVQSGLSGGERILSEGGSFVEPGQPVRPVDAEVTDAHH